MVAMILPDIGLGSRGSEGLGAGAGMRNGLRIDVNGIAAHISYTGNAEQYASNSRVLVGMGRLRHSPDLPKDFIIYAQIGRTLMIYYE
jgi:hypothetical protein